MWSQWPWVETISFSVQSRAASSSAIQARHGVAVSMAIASRERGVGEDVDVGRDRPDDPVQPLHEAPLARALEFRLHAVEGLADHLVGGAFDHPRADASQGPG